MKSIKEKAKAYDEALARANEMIKSMTNIGGVAKVDDIQHIFPELKEGDGDKWIPKEIAKYLKEKGDFRSCWLAWLEKQCEQKIKTPEESLGIDSDTYNKIVDECIYGEQKPTDNVEPKFHEGEWIIHHGTEIIYQVVARIDNQYQLKYGDNYTIQKCADVDRCARLWDITKDAKDGDMLAWDDSKCIALFKNIYDEDSFNSYGFVGGCTGTFESRQSYHDIEDAHPATKEQRDLLFQKMHEAGYEWDAEKKELIKIEQKFTPKYKNGDCIEYRGGKYKITKVTVTPHNFFYDVSLIEVHSDLEEVVISIGMAAEEQMFKIEQKPAAWSEEDDEMYKKIETAIDSYYAPFSRDAEEMSEWFKNLKDRVQHQNTWKPSEEQMNNQRKTIIKKQIK